MTRDVIVRICGLHTGVEETESYEPIEVITPGTYFLKNGKHYVLYEEVTEGMPGTTKNQIKITEDCLELRKSGITNTHMIFESGKKTLTSYETPFGQLVMGIRTNRFCVSQEEEEIEVRADYQLEVNDEAVADCRIRLNIRAKEQGKFSLEA